MLFIQCKSCKEKFAGCCGKECQESAALPLNKQSRPQPKSFNNSRKRLLAKFFDGRQK
jgi:UPF0176 protein